MTITNAKEGKAAFVELYLTRDKLPETQMVITY